jgi:nucleotide-binding universal stress UspA family protein
MLRTILVPLDGSEFGEHALPLAIGLAKAAGARLHLSLVHEPLESAYAEIRLEDGFDARATEREKAYLHAMQVKVREAFPGPVAASFLEGNVAARLRDEAATIHADLVVMTTHARGPLARFWLGSVTDKLVRTTAVPLLLVRPQDGRPDLTAGVRIRHILVPLDGTPLAEQILEPVMQLGRLLEAEFTLTRVVKPILPLTLPPEAGAYGDTAARIMQKVERAHEYLKQEARDYLEQVATRFAAEGLRACTQVVVEEQAAVGILGQARRPIDLIAMQTHGRGGLSRLLLGSTADKVIRGATIPVLIQRPRA